jgi:hypothetical protein
MGNRLNKIEAEFEDSFDQQLVAWLARRRSVWSGTAAELLTAVRTGLDVSEGSWPESPSTLYGYLESRRQLLRSLGVDVVLRQGPPRMLSLRLCQAEEAVQETPTPHGINHSSDPSFNLLGLVDDPKTGNTVPGDENVEASKTVKQDTSVARPDWTARFVSGRYAADRGGRIFENTGEALLAIGAMQEGIAGQDCSKSAIDLVGRRTQEVTRSCGIVVGLLQQDTIIYPFRAGTGVAMQCLDLQANFFRSCIRTGKALRLQDAQSHPLLGATCQLEGIGSLIIVPIFHNREVAAAVEFFFKEMRSFSPGFVMDLELIAGALSELLARVSSNESQ